ncbi:MULTISPECIES: type II toxin-antitoxin system RelE/ParE family toxin [unclassified Desulfovibrio]|uniref:type II toxin-antitoxin system RelE/ParE family toxin n=1 Tax=unclassified Desulfovibrio TaxID=2593640 RepID=UPI000F5F9D4D|nr:MULTISPECIES: type II toxin-antitoxin system RelE/ParE family toxin [unclassified Desulfovibrio]RRD68963.1 peptidase [Desulfovibrio sp. OH1209_COT-279]RRD83038.1 peptidase [Desulfovibrio sp. OH1186_COT-070]
MIKSFAHKGLEDFFYDGTTRGIQPKHAAKLRWQLDRLENAVTVQDMNAPGYDLHPLKGNLKGHWAVRVSGNWRLTFRFEDGNAYVVNYQDYH